MTVPPKVSIIMPAYRAAHWLPHSVASVRAQTVPEWELLIVDDRSTDDTVAVAESLAAGDPRIRVLRTHAERGPSAARSVGLRSATGRYIAYLDADDLWMPTKLERQLADLTVRGAGFSFTAYRRINDSGNRVGRLQQVPPTLDHRGLLGHTAIVTSSVLLDRDRVGPIVPRNTYHDDFVLWLDLLRGGGAAVGLNEDLVRYRVSRKSYSRNKARMAWHVWLTYREVEGLGVARSLWFLSQYGSRAAVKYLLF